MTRHNKIRLSLHNKRVWEEKQQERNLGVLRLVFIDRERSSSDIYIKHNDYE